MARYCRAVTLGSLPLSLPSLRCAWRMVRVLRYQSIRAAGESTGRHLAHATVVVSSAFMQAL